jgi:hypothetical protein
LSEDDSSVRHSKTALPRPKTWIWASLLALALLASAALVYFFVLEPADGEDAGGGAGASAQTVTPPPPTPTVPVPSKEPGTEFYDRIPATVGKYVLTETAPSADFENAKAYDSYALTYSDGEHQITLLAGQWRTEAAATDAFNALGGPEGWPGADVDLSSTVCPEPPDEDTAALWRNQTAIFKVDAPDGGAGEFFCLMPM